MPDKNTQIAKERFPRDLNDSEISPSTDEIISPLEPEAQVRLRGPAKTVEGGNNVVVGDFTHNKEQKVVPEEGGMSKGGGEAETASGASPEVFTDRVRELVKKLENDHPEGEITGPGAADKANKLVEDIEDINGISQEQSDLRRAA